MRIANVDLKSEANISVTTTVSTCWFYNCAVIQINNNGLHLDTCKISTYL